MNRRNFFKVVTGFVAGIFATSAKSEPKYSCSASASGHPSAENSAEPKSMTIKEWVEAQYIPVKELRFGEPFTGKIVSMTTFQGNLWIATENGVYEIRENFS